MRSNSPQRNFSFAPKTAEAAFQLLVIMGLLLIFVLSGDSTFHPDAITWVTLASSLFIASFYQFKKRQTLAVIRAESVVSRYQSVPRKARLQVTDPLLI